MNEWKKDYAFYLCIHGSSNKRYEKIEANELHAVFFIRNSVKGKLVMFLIFPQNFYSFCFLAEEKMMVFVS